MGRAYARKYGADSKVTTCYANSDTPLAQQLINAISKIDGVIDTVETELDNGTAEILPADPTVRNFTHTIVDGDLYFRENEVMVKVTETGKSLERMKGLHTLRQATMELINAQADGCTDEQLAELQKKLNSTYDNFRTKFGNITDSANSRCFSNDDDYNTLAALEVVNVENKTVEKAAIFTKRTILPDIPVSKVDTALEALQVSMDRLGKVDILYMSQLTDTTPEKVIADLGDEIFRDPAKVKDNDPYSGYTESSEYLSGNIRDKLRIARDHAEHIDSSYNKNVEALMKVVPKDLEASEISVRIGANWIDVADYNNFFNEYAHANTYYYPVTRTKLGEYKIEGKTSDRSVAATETFGTSRMNSYQIFENLLNQRDILVRDRREEGDKVWYEINTKETQLAKEKARLMKEAFRNWLWEDMGRREKYVAKYNYLFNSIRGREYDGSHQTFPGMNTSITLRKHQSNAIMRAKLGGNTLFAHEVGAGKSFEMVATVMEKKRLGLINKACVVVPKHLTLQMASEWLRLYPNAKLLVAKPEDFTKANRKRFIARCVTGDYDAVIMSFTQFERIPMSDEYKEQFMQKELHDIMSAISEAGTKDKTSVKALERQKKNIEERLEKLLSSPKDSSLCFEKLGFDYLVCDEAHNYKNCFVSTKMSNVAGVQTTAAQKSEDMLMKTQYLNNKYGCNNILFATGEPIELGTYRGFKVTIERNPSANTFFELDTPCIAVLHGELTYSCDVATDNGVGNVRRIENLAGIQINQKLCSLEEQLEKANKDLSEAQQNMLKPFEHGQELAEKTKRLEYVNAQLSGNSQNKNHTPESAIEFRFHNNKYQALIGTNEKSEWCDVVSKGGKLIASSDTKIYNLSEKESDQFRSYVFNGGKTDTSKNNSLLEKLKPKALKL